MQVLGLSSKYPLPAEPFHWPTGCFLLQMRFQERVQFVTSHKVSTWDTWTLHWGVLSDDIAHISNFSKSKSEGTSVGMLSAWAITRKPFPAFNFSA